MSLHPEALTWMALLGRWMQFAQASLALREEQDGDRWRASVPAIINLQAVTFALGDLDQLPPEEHALAIDRAELLITSSAARLDAIWLNAVRSPSLNEIIADARHALAMRRQSKPTDTHPTN
jgi:hypothetical protein